MRLRPDMGTALAPMPLEPASRCVVSWFAADLSIHPFRTGHVGRLTRGSTAAFVDQAGGSMTAVHAEPRWEPRDLDGDSLRESMGLLMGTSDHLVWQSVGGGIGFRPGALAGEIRFIETGARTDSTATLFAICNDAVTGCRLFIHANGSYYVASWHDGTNGRSAVLSAGQPQPGDYVVLRWQWYPNGTIQIWQSINGGAETTTLNNTALTIPGAWGTGAVMRVNRRGASANFAEAWYHSIKMVRGEPTPAYLRRVR